MLEGRYEIVRPIGRGGMGAVYEAIQLDLGRRVAVKVLESGAEAVRLAQEARALATLNHPNVVTVLDSRPEASPPFIAMDLVNGRSIEQLIAEGGRLEARRAAILATQLLSALAAAHHAGIIHRDVKPSNVLVIEGGPLNDLVKVVDFGIAKLTIDPMKQTTRGVLIGSLAYMAPEQILGRRIDARVDIFATGVTLYKMLSGRVPFDGEGAPQVALAICQQEPPVLVAPPPLVAIVQRAMQKDPNARYASADEMRTALEVYLASVSGGAGYSSAPMTPAGQSAFASTVGPSGAPPGPSPVAPTAAMTQSPLAGPPPAGHPPVGHPPVGHPSHDLMPMHGHAAPAPYFAPAPRRGLSQELKILGIVIAGATFLMIIAGVIAAADRIRNPAPAPTTYDAATLAIDIPPDQKPKATQAEEDAIRRKMTSFAGCFRTSQMRPPAYMKIEHGESVSVIDSEASIDLTLVVCAQKVDHGIPGVRPGLVYKVRF